MTAGASVGKYLQNELGKTAFPDDQEVKALSPHYRLMIALHSPEGIVETGLLVCPPERRVGKLARGDSTGHFSGAVSNQNVRICADFSQFWRECGRLSLQPRLYGGEIGIRTFITLLCQVS